MWQGEKELALLKPTFSIFQSHSHELYISEEVTHVYNHELEISPNVLVERLSEFGAFFISNIGIWYYSCQSLPQCWSVLLELMSYLEKAQMSTEVLELPNEIQSEPHLGSAGH